MTNHHKCFDFLREGEDKQFESAMKSIDTMYDNLFNGDKLDKLFENLKYQNNSITQPIDQMTKEIFKTEQKYGGPVYVKTETVKNSAEDDCDFVVGQPLYIKNGVQPYQNKPENEVGRNRENYQQYKNNFTNPYYKTGGDNYFGNWQQRPHGK